MPCSLMADARTRDAIEVELLGVNHGRSMEKLEALASFSKIPMAIEMCSSPADSSKMRTRRCLKTVRVLDCTGCSTAGREAARSGRVPQQKRAYCKFWIYCLQYHRCGYHVDKSK